MKKITLLIISLLFFGVFSTQAQQTTYIARIQVNDSWTYSDNINYTVINEYSKRQDWAKSDHLNSFQIEIASNQTLEPFFDSFEFNLTHYYVIDDFHASEPAYFYALFNLSNTSIDRRLYTQRGNFFVYESGSADVYLDVEKYYWEPKTNHTYSLSESANFELYTLGDIDPSVSVANGQPLESRMILDVLDIKFYFDIYYVPSDSFTIQFQEQPTDAVNISTTIDLVGFDLQGLGINPETGLMETTHEDWGGYSSPIDINWTNIEVLSDERTFSYDIGLPIYQSTKLKTNKLIKLMPSKSVFRELIKWSVADSIFKIYQSDTTASETGYQVIVLLATLPIVLAAKTRRKILKN
jgi:hypothetical protein